MTNNEYNHTDFTHVLNTDILKIFLLVISYLDNSLFLGVTPLLVPEKLF